MPDDKPLFEPGTFVPRNELDALKSTFKIEPAPPCCGNCPTSAKFGAQRQCRAEPSKIFMVPGQNVAGQPTLNFMAQYPPVTDTEVCGKHPIIAGRVAAMAEIEKERFLRENLAKVA